MKAKDQERQESSPFPKIGAPAMRALTAAGYTHLEQLTKATETELGKLHGMGPKALGLLREALKAKGMSFAEAGKTGADVKRRASVSAVDEFMENLDHPFKVEVEALREFIKKVNKDIVEEIKWKAPSYSYKGEYLVTFNLWETKRVHLVFHNPMIAKVKSKMLEGDYEDRRMAYFTDMKDIKAKKTDLEKILKGLIKLQRK